MLSRLILFGLFSLTSLLLNAQPGVAPTKTVDGEKFYVHQVEPGNTLWGLQQMYDVKVDAILKSNASLVDGLKVGQSVLIPFKEKAPAVEVVSNYKVRKGETLYGISRKFSTSVDHLYELNPEAINGIQKGQLIKVPGDFIDSTEDIVEVPVASNTPNPFVVDTVKIDGKREEVKIYFNDSIIEHIVLPHETMYSISKRFMVPIEKIMKLNHLTSTSLKEGQMLIIPIKQENFERVQIKPVPPKYNPNGSGELVFPIKDKYKVVVLLPFYLDYGPGYSEYVSGLATQYYMGTALAIDSLKKKGLNADFIYLDTRNDSLTVMKILQSDDMMNVDMVVGPFFGRTQNMVANHCRINKIRMICPVSVEPGVMEGNRLVYSAVPTNMTIFKSLAAKMLENNKNDNILLIKPVKESDLLMYNAFRDGMSHLPTTGKRPAIIETNMEDMKNFMRRGVKNIFIMPTNDKATAMKFMNSLNKSAFRSTTDDIIVYGTKEWVNFTDINSAYKNKYNFHFASGNHLDYYSEATVELNKLHRAVYKTDLSRMAVQGYDVMTYFCSSFFLNNPNPSLVMNDFNLEKNSDEDGFENNHIFIIEQEDYELIDVTKE